MGKDKLALCHILSECRHRRGLTQEEVAEHLKVSKASVSKWETGFTYPDITMLPRIAAFFGISMDELFGYRPQLTNEELRRIYASLSRDFAEKPFDLVMEGCQETAKKYYSCCPLLLQIGALYLNHCSLAGTPEKAASVLEEAKKLFQKVRQESNDPGLCMQSTHLEAMCLLQTGRPKEAAELLESICIVRMTPEPLLAQAYQMMKNPEKAKALSQAGIYQALLELLSILYPYLSFCRDKASLKEAYGRILSLADTFHLSSLQPSALLSVYLTAAQSFMALGESESALDALERYTDLALSDIYPIRLHGDEFFNLLEGWLEDNLLLGADIPPRDEKLILKSIAEAFSIIPELQPLSSDPRFLGMKKRLSRLSKEASE